MTRYLILIIITLLHIGVYGQNNFNQLPWLNENYPILIDPYQANKIDFDKLISDKRVAGIIHKASQGLSADAEYLKRSKTAALKGLLFASYHLGTNADPIKQADFYLKQIGNDTSQPMALDIEKLDDKNISLPNAEKFINHIFKKTGRYPMIYINNEVFQIINSKYDRQSAFAKCKLWYARFLNTLPALATNVWDSVFLWQFACEINCADGHKYKNNCPYKVPGTDYNMDINVFNGNLADLKEYWNNTAAK